MVTIYDYAGSELVSFEAYPSGSTYSCRLMQEDYITLVFPLVTPIYFPVGAYVDTDFGRFILLEQQNPSYNASDGSYRYSLRMEKYYMAWKNKIFKFLPEDGNAEAAWGLTAELSVHMDVFLRNLVANGWSYGGAAYRYEVDSSLTGAKYIRYSATNLIDALTEIAEAWECEWWVTSNVIHFGTCDNNNLAQEGTKYTFDLLGLDGSVAGSIEMVGNISNEVLNIESETIMDGGVANIVGGTKTDLRLGVNLETMTSSRAAGRHFNRLYCFGSTRNIPAGYRQGSGTGGSTIAGIAEKRLMLPLSYNDGKNYVDAEAGMDASQIVEGVYTNDEIYPKRVGEIGAVTTYSKTATDDETGEEVTKTFYRFTDADSTFHFSKDYILEGQTLHVVFESGALAGMDFELAFNPDGEAEKDGSDNWRTQAQVYEIIMNSTYGMELPAGTLIPAAGDEYVITGFDISLVGSSYVAAAEQELLAAAQEYMEQSKVDNNNYTCTLMADYSYSNDVTNGKHLQAFQLGDSVRLVNAAFFEGGTRISRVQGWELDLQQPYNGARIIVGNKANYSHLGALEASIKEVDEKAGKRGKAGKAGKAGERGAMPRARGLYSATETYVYDDNYRDIVYDAAGDVWMVKNSGDSLTGVTPSSTSEFWLQADKSIFTAIDTALIENANIAGFMYKGGLMVSQATDADDNPMLELDGVNGIIKAQQGEFTGTINSSSGVIGGFTLSSTDLTSTGGTGGTKSMSLSADNVSFANGSRGVIAKFGSGSVIDSAAAYATMTNPLYIRVIAVTPNVAAIHIDVTGGTAYDPTAGSGNTAINILNGKICGFRLNVRRVTASTQLDVLDSVIINNATSNITLTLPAWAEDGQMYWIKNNSSAGGTILAVSASSGQTINDGKSNAKTSWTHSTGEMLFVVYDAINKIWQAGYLNCN